MDISDIVSESLKPINTPPPPKQQSFLIVLYGLGKFSDE